MARRNEVKDGNKIAIYAILAFLFFLTALIIVSLRTVLNPETLNSSSSAQETGGFGAGSVRFNLANCFASCSVDSQCRGGLVCGRSGANTNKCVPPTCRYGGTNCRCTSVSLNRRSSGGNTGTGATGAGGSLRPTNSQPQRGAVPGSTCYTDSYCRSGSCVKSNPQDRAGKCL